MSDSVRPHRRQPTRLPRPWDSPGKNTGVGCPFLLQCVKVKSESEAAQSCPTLNDPRDCMQPSRLLRPRDFPGKSTGAGCQCLLHYSVAWSSFFYLCAKNGDLHYLKSVIFRAGIRYDLLSEHKLRSKERHERHKRDRVILKLG